MATGNTEGDRCEYQDKNSSLKGEIGRQLIHLLTGVVYILLIYATGEKALLILLLLFAFYLATSFVISKNVLPTSLSPFLCRWGRPEKQNIPLKGNILLLCGIIPSLILFPEEIVYASIAIVGFGDSVSTVTGVTIGRHKLPYSEEKTVEGTLAGIIAAFLASLFFVTPAQAFVGSTGGMLLESVVDLQTVKELNSQAVFRFFLNDNFLIPIFSGLLMFITGLFQN